MASGYRSTPETTNYARLCRLVVDIGTDVLRHLINTQLNHAQLGVGIINNKNKLWPILNHDQRQLLYGPGANPGGLTAGQFDISLLYILLRNLCPRIGTPTNGWGHPPPAIAPGQPLADEVERIRTSRNTIYGHVTHTAVSNADFSRYWADIDAVLGRLDQAWGTQFLQHAQQLKVEGMDPQMEQGYARQFHVLCLKDQQTQHRVQALDGQVHTLSLSDQQTQQRVQALDGQVHTLSLSDQQTQHRLQVVEGK
jgi:hypothetical protein